MNFTNNISFPASDLELLHSFKGNPLSVSFECSSSLLEGSVDNEELLDAEKTS